ncbi:pseudouridine synthase [Marinobacterium jannaschii]|uniref:pseudouridine synthase n=1 Tax=Marinobacterium jannaschii TaxID=64970 RepID=UPI000489E069|nr:pseudouridine synthase [Marinobacterium jannaschii]
MRLDRFLTKQAAIGNREARIQLATGQVRVDGEVVRDGLLQINELQRIELGDRLLQARSERYYMLHKPKGYVSATVDNEHPTVLDLLDLADKDDLHIGGRLDLNTSGLLILTNNGRWSRRLTQPEEKIPKVYRVETQHPIEAEYAEVFRRGIYFAYENLTTLPAELEQLGANSARLTIYEGRYHQVKRMFGHFRNAVVGLHRESMGEILLDPALAEGEYRALTPEEVASV